jgi:hypothetical protein
MKNDFHQKENGTRNVQNKNGRKPIFKDFFSLGKDQEKMKEKRGENQKSKRIQPVKDAVQSIELSRGGKNVE